MLPSPVTDIKAFVPAKDLNVSKAFYTDLGFAIQWSNEEIAELQIGSFRFLLQKFYVAQHAGNFMMGLNVENVDAWWGYIQQKELTKKYAPDGEYIPRTHFLSPDGELDPAIHAPREKFQYFYDEKNPASVLAGMEEALKKHGSKS